MMINNHLSKLTDNLMFIIILLCFSFLFINQPVTAQLLSTPAKALIVAEDKDDEATKPVMPKGPKDDYQRGVPRSSIKGYLNATNRGDNELATQYMDLRRLPNGLAPEDGPELAKKLKIILDRALWLDMELISNDPAGKSNDELPAYRDSLGQIQAGGQTIDILMQRVPRGDGVSIWKISNRTIGQIPLLYQFHGYTPLEEYLEGIFPDVLIFGWQSWQWATYIVLHLTIFLFVWLLTSTLSYMVRRDNNSLREKLSDYIKGPLFFVIWILISRPGVDLMGPSESIRVMHETATVLYIVMTWAIVRLVDLLGFWFTTQLEKKGRMATTILLRPIKTVFKVMIIIAALLLWLDNLGVHVGTLMASLGIGGFAIALAAQDMLKNLLGSVMILIDRPYEIGQRIVAKGNDGIVEEIGLRSTKIRLLNGHQVTIPNEEMAKIEIENIGRRPHIRRSSNLAIPLDTPAEKVERAIQIVKDNLHNHECLDPRYPPRVYFNDFNRDSINIKMIIWYASTDYWAFQAFNQKLNLNIIKQFEAEGIHLALPSFTAYAEHEKDQHIQNKMPIASQPPQC